MKFVTFNSLKEIGPDSFSNCHSLIKISCPILQIIKEYSFYNCDELIMLNTPQLKQCENCAFYNCDKLEVIGSVKVLNYECVNAFEECCEKCPKCKGTLSNCYEKYFKMNYVKIVKNKCAKTQLLQN